MNAIEIIELIQAQGANTKEALLVALEDGAALKELGVFDSDQTELEDAYNMAINASLSFSLNKIGQEELLASILKLSNDNLTTPTEYFSDAELVADRWNCDEDASLEIDNRHTLSGSPEIIILKKEWFDSKLCY